MKKNVAGQVIGAQLVAASDGSAFTGSVTVYVTGDGGTQAVGSVGSGACTHEGNGFHTYAPAQGETNYDHVAFTFVGTGAVPVTVQVFTTYPQSGDGFARLGAPAGASLSADVAAVKTVVDGILVDTAEIGAAGAGLTALASAVNLASLSASVGAIPTAIENADALLDRDMSAVTEAGGGARTPLQAFRMLRNRWVITGSTQSIKKEDDSTESWSQELGTTPGADPVTSTDPS